MVQWGGGSVGARYLFFIIFLLKVLLYKCKNINNTILVFLWLSGRALR